MNAENAKELLKLEYAKLSTEAAKKEKEYDNIKLDNLKSRRSVMILRIVAIVVVFAFIIQVD